MINKCKIVYPFIILVIIYLIFVTYHIHKLVVADEVEFMTGCADLNISDVIHSYKDSPGPKYRIIYPYSISLFFSIFNESPEVARIPGILSHLLTIFLIYQICINVSDNRKTGKIIGLSACCIYGFHPMAIQGSLIIGSDNTILTSMIYLFFYFFIKRKKSEKFGKLVLLGIFLSLILLCKPTPLPFIILTISLIYVLKLGLKNGSINISIIFGIGFGLYILIWWVYSGRKDLPFYLPFTNLYNHITYQIIFGSILDKIMSLVVRIIRVVVWASPFQIIICVIVTAERIIKFVKKGKIYSSDFLYIYFWSVFIGYILIGGTNFGFPRYHFPMLPALSIINAYAFYKIMKGNIGKNIDLFALIILLLVVYNIYCVGDLIYSLNYELRESLISDSVYVKSTLIKISSQIGLYLMPLIVIYCIFKRKLLTCGKVSNYLITLFICALGANVSLNIIQLSKKYNTGYEYGGVGYRESIDYLNEKLEQNDVIIANESIIYNFNRSNNGYSPYFTPDKYDNIKTLKNSLKMMEPSAVVFGITLNTIDQIKKVFNSKEIENILERKYNKKIIGSLNIWIKKRKDM